MILALKLLLSPLLIIAASLLARRFGPTVGGWLIGLPVTAGPVALFLALEHGAAFSARVATGFVAGVSAQAAFVLGYVAVARRDIAWPLALAAGAASFTLTGVGLEELRLSVPLLLACALLLLIVGLRIVPSGGAMRAHAPGRRELAVRMVAATSLVLLVTGFASRLGPGLSGVATTFPLLSTILAVSVHRVDPRTAIAVYRGLLVGLFALAGFATTLALVLARAPIAVAFAGAIALTISIQLGSLPTLRRGTAVSA